MKKKYKKILLLVLVVFILIEMVNTLISPDTPFFVYPSGSDEEIGEAIGLNTWRIMEFIIIIYGIRRLIKDRKRDRNTKKEQ